MRIRRRPPGEPWRLRRVVTWAGVAVAGDPAMLLVPALAVAAITIVTFALGAPGRPEVVVPALAAPPADAFADAAVVGLVDRSTAAAWAARALMVLVRAVVFGILAGLAAARAAGGTPALGAAARLVAARARTLVPLALLAAGYAEIVSGGGRIEPGREAGVAGTALVAGMLFFPIAFVAAVADGRGLAGSLRRSGRWILTRPLGHLGLVAGYAAAFGGTIRLALFGEVARPRALPVTLYAILGALITAVFVAGLTRRYALLYADSAPPAGGTAPRGGRRSQPGRGGSETPKVW